MKLIIFFSFFCRNLLLHSKNNIRKDKSLDIWANLKRSKYDNLLHWACQKLKSWGVFSKVEDDYISGKTRVQLKGKQNFISIGHEEDIFAIISDDEKKKLFKADTKNELGYAHLSHIDF